MRILAEFGPARKQNGDGQRISMQAVIAVEVQVKDVCMVASWINRQEHFAVLMIKELRHILEYICVSGGSAVHRSRQ